MLTYAYVSIRQHTSTYVSILFNTHTHTPAVHLDRATTAEDDVEAAVTRTRAAARCPQFAKDDVVVGAKERERE
jgi:hypothetical protein